MPPGRREMIVLFYEVLVKACLPRESSATYGVLVIPVHAKRFKRVDSILGE